MRDRGRLGATRTALAATAAFLALVPAGWAAGSGQTGEAADGPSPEAKLRGVFVDPGTAADVGDRTVGRLALHLVREEGSEQVGIEHVFRSGDRFRFAITPSRGGWVFVLHRPPAGEAEVLWPPEGVSTPVPARTTSEIPPRPQAFAFDEEVGEESFYVVIRAAPDPPPAGGELRAADGAEEARSEAEAAVRALGEGKPRGAFFDPGPQDEDRHVYFAPADDDDGTVAIVELRLRHE